MLILPISNYNVFIFLKTCTCLKKQLELVLITKQTFMDYRKRKDTDSTVAKG